MKKSSSQSRPKPRTSPGRKPRPTKSIVAAARSIEAEAPATLELVEERVGRTHPGPGNSPRRYVHDNGARERRSEGERHRAGKAGGKKASGGKRRRPLEIPAISVTRLAEVTAEIAGHIERSVLGVSPGRRADRELATSLRNRHELALADQRFVSRATFSLFRWRGWVEFLKLESIEERLLWSCLLDSPTMHPALRVWARMAGREPERLMPLGDAPDWPARSEGWRRLHGGRHVNADPWRLFPTWFRERLPIPPGGESPKARYIALLEALQRPAPLWVRVQEGDPKAVWNELRDQGQKPWVHRRITSAAKLDHGVDLHHSPIFERGAIEIQDLASQAVGFACDPDPGERWWDACAGAGGKALHLASLMKGRGVVVATDVHARPLQECVRRARRSPFRNLTTHDWDGKHVAGRTASFDGVLVDAPCSAIGTWRRNPDARWTLECNAIDRLAALQGRILGFAAAGVKPGGVLVYSVCTITASETRGVVQAFLDTHPQFALDPFPNPLDGAPCDGMLQIWPQDADSDAMFIARMIRTAKRTAQT